jgi:putative transposase
LRQAFQTVQADFPFTIEAIVVLPDHIHALWTLPDNDADYSSRWRRIKAQFSRQCPPAFKSQPSLSRFRKGEQAIWQRRFWEHQIRNEADFSQHVDYIHYNPVKHGLVPAPKDWPYSSFQRYVKAGVYPVDWGADGEVPLDERIGYE